MQLKQKRVLEVLDGEGRQKLGIIAEGDEVQMLDDRGRYKYGEVKRIADRVLIMITDGKEWTMPLKYIEHIAKKA